MMSTFFISKSTVLAALFFNLLGGFAWGQTNGPSICDCAKYAKDDPLLLSRCEQKFDYNNMSVFERSTVESLMKACDDPDVCDCAYLSANDTIIQAACDLKFNEDSLSQREYEDYLEDKAECIQYPNKPGLKTICQCLEDHDEDDYNYRHCKDIWDISHLSSHERLEFVEDISNCLDHVDDPDFTLSLCDCMNARGDDIELKERCIKKFDLNSMDEAKVRMYKEKMKDCQFETSGGSDIEIICNCIKEERELGKISPQCERALQELELKYRDSSEEEMAELYRQLMECMRE